MTTTGLSNADLWIMFALHDAFRRDAERLARVAARFAGDDPDRRAALLVGWRLFSGELHHHHGVEDNRIWPQARERCGTEALAVLQAMEDEHALVDPAISAVEATFEEPDCASLPDAVEHLVGVLRSHLDHEERYALPVLQQTITPGEWRALSRSVQREMGLKGAATVLPWIMDDLPPRRAQQVLDELPVPMKVLYRYRWNPRYRRTRRWE
ncbi:hemerythrin domain-containing protein [Kribbella sp. CA-253562]|uniref:hemerythrin domain-containing protein n=1 Tax=Kribbella sp. CA-253562 TaxID=3239942 RepID=UPI003D8AFD91